MFVVFFHSVWHIIFFGPRRREIVCRRFKFFFLLNGPYDDLSPSWRIDLPQSEDFLVIQVFSHRRVWFFLNLISAGETELEDSITLRARNPGISTLTNDLGGKCCKKQILKAMVFRRKKRAVCFQHWGKISGQLISSVHDQHLLLQGSELLTITSDAGFNGGRETTSR